MICPVLLCGGGGNRLWPLARRSLPEALIRLSGNESSLQSTARRFAIAGFEAPAVVTSECARHAVAEQLADAKIAPDCILLEPEPRGTAAAALLAALWLRDARAGGLILLQPCGDFEAEPGALCASLNAAVPAAHDGYIVAFGVNPAYPDPACDYLELRSPYAGTIAAPWPLLRRVEMPGARSAEEMAASGRHLWNMGVYLCTAETLIGAFEAHAPATLERVAAGLRQSRREDRCLCLPAEPWSQIDTAALDRIIIGNAANIAVVPCRADRSRVDGWNSVWQSGGQDEDGNILSERTLGLDCRRSLLRAESDGLQLVGIGLEDIVAVAMPDAVLVAHRSAGHRVRDAVGKLAARAARQAFAFSHTPRPWGSFETLTRGDRFHVKRIVVRPGGSLSLQSHARRDEHWIVVEGTAWVTLGSDVREVAESEAVHVPRGTRHRLENRNRGELIVIEIQTGSYFGEDDIIRYEDAYGRL